MKRAVPMSSGTFTRPNAMSTLTVDAETELDLELAAPSRLPRALAPFRHTAYRRLAVALVLSGFASESGSSPRSGRSSGSVVDRPSCRS